MQLREHDKLFLEMGIADYVSPEFNPIPDTNSFLLVLSADREFFKLWPFVKSVAKTTGLILLLRLAYVLFTSHGGKISELWNKIVEHSILTDINKIENKLKELEKEKENIQDSCSHKDVDD